MSRHLILKGSTWHVRLDVPKDVRGHPNFMMKKVLTKSLKTGNHQAAVDASREVLIEWKKRINEARDKKGLSSWKIHAEAKKQNLDANLYIAKTAEEFQKIKYDQLLEAAKIINEYGLKNHEREEALQFMVNNTRPKTTISPQLINEFERYQAKNFVGEKTASMQASHIREIIKYIDINNIGLTHDSVEKYLDSLDIKSITKRNRLFSGNSFWDFLEYKDKSIKNEPNPFHNHNLQRAKKGKGKDQKNSYIPFTQAEIEKIYKAAMDKGDTVLADTIKIAALTGCRIAEICKLTTSNIQKNNIVIENAKTNSGNRHIPIHPNIKELVDSLIKKSTDGFLISSSSGNKYGNRSDSISKRFGRLKTTLGFESGKVFHSIRKTTATLLQRAGVPPLTIAAIMGHKVNHITFDIYSAGPSFQQKDLAIKKLQFKFN
ncbi:MAG: tyrosine-type recombinase/integrase [Pseudomonas sp.]|uniref:tyrosine-type recombinase/integrase n=1 Tax=Pseudomonas sp. TaxID=306 RepID=UPI0039826C9D